jgi:hypothetical protein
MKVTALTALVNGIADAVEAGATASDVQMIFEHEGARSELFHSVTRNVTGQETDDARLRQIVFGLRDHGCVGLKMED